MKRGTKSIFYISITFFSCLLMMLFATNNIKAETSFGFSCIDEDTGLECAGTPASFYYQLNQIGLDENFTGDLVIPSSYNGAFGIGDVLIVGSNANANIVTIGGTGHIEIDSITLPSQVREIKGNVFNNDRIDSIGEVVIPTSTRTIGATLFSNATTVDELHLNHYQWSDGLTTDQVVMDAHSFDNVDKIVCGDLNVYDYYLTNENSTLQSAPLTVIYTFVYHTYEGEALNNVTDTKYYYLINGYIEVDTISADLSVSGLNFLSWRLKKGPNNYEVLSNSMNIARIDNTETTFHVYPHFELTPLTFTYSANEETATYDASANLITLSLTNISHTLKNDPDFSYPITWKKNNNIVSGATSDTLNLGLVNDSGTYIATITATYVYGGITYTREASDSKVITINKAPLYVSIKNKTTTYGTYITAESIEYEIIGNLETGSVENITFNYPHTSAYHNVGTYAGALQLDTLSIQVSSVEKISNYNIIVAPGNYIVEQLDIDAYYTDNSSFTFGEPITISKLYDNNVYGASEQVIVDFLTDGVDAGNHNIVDVASLDDNNYRAVFNESLTTGVVTILQREVTLDYDITSSTYDGNEQSVNVYYTDVNSVKVSVPYTIVGYVNDVLDSNAVPTKFVNAGVYVLQTNQLDDTNYYLDITGEHATIEVTLNRYTTTPANLTYSTYQSVIYSGSRIYPSVIIDNEEQHATYTCRLGLAESDCTNVGSYSVSVAFAKTVNYNALQVDVTLAVQPRYINLSPKNFNIYFGETPVLEETLTIQGEEVKVVYYTDAVKNSPVGSYSITNAIIKNAITGADHNNYRGTILYEECENKVHVTKRPAELVYYNYTDLVYNSKVQDVGAYVVDTLTNKVIDTIDLDIICDEGEIKGAGEYHLHAHLTSDTYYIENQTNFTFTIAKATYDLSNIKLNDAKYVFSFKKRSISIDGKLPEGVKVQYTIDGKEGNSTARLFSHTITAKLISEDGNYTDIPELKATLYIDGTWVFVTIITALMLAGIIIGAIILYTRYRREHPRKIKLKIKNVTKEDLAAKRLANSVKEVLAEDGDDKDEEIEPLENEDDIVENTTDTFVERIYAADSDLKYYYSEVKNEILSYDGITHTVDRKYEVFYHGTRQIAKLSICNHVLRLYVNLDPEKYDESQYHQRDMSNFEVHAHTPLRIKVNTTESLRNAKIFIRILRKKENLRPVSSFVRIDYEKFYTLKESIFPKWFKKSNKAKK